MAKRFIHWSAGAWWKDSVGEAGGANGREAEGGVVSQSQVGGVGLLYRRRAATLRKRRDYVARPTRGRG